jgi:predicted ATPase/transcriptional regulator with XRE-family HTH domain
MNTNGSFGDWLRQRRKALDLTQADLADQVSCSLTTIRKIESGKRRPSRQISERMADVLAISAEERPAFINFARRVAVGLSSDLAALTPTSSLPAHLTPFIGRESELAQIMHRLNDPACRLLTLVGPGGIGKTRLALQAASDCVGKYADGVFFVSLSPVGSTILISAAIASALQVSFYRQEDPDTQIVNYLRSKHMLLVLDNYEHLLGGIGLLADILANAPRLKLLVTSRERLNMQEEWVLPVAGLPYPAHDTNGETGKYDAVDLFTQTARRIDSGFSLVGNEAAVIDICRAVEGMPLGIELAATWLRVMPCDQIAGQIRRDLDFLATPLRNIEERHRSLRTVFEHSWNLLSEAERDVMMRLSVFRGGCGLEAAEQVAGASLLRLAGLVDKSLVRLNTAGCYEMHELLRQFAADKLMKSGQAKQTRHRHLWHYLSLAEQIQPNLFGSNQIPAWDRIEMEHDNMRAALDWADHTGSIEGGLRLAGALGWFWNRRVHWVEGREWLIRFLAADDESTPALRAVALHHLLELNYEMNNLVYVEARRQEAVELLDRVEDPRSRAWLLTTLGFVFRFPDGLNQAYLEEAHVLFQELGDQWGVCEVIGRLAIDQSVKGNNDRAETLWEEGIRLASQAGDKIVLAWAIALLATSKLAHGITDAGTERLYDQSLALFSEMRFKSGIAYTLYGLAVIAQVQGKTERMKLLYKECLSLCAQTGKGYGISCLFNLAKIFLAEHDVERAAKLLGTVSTRVDLLGTC